MDPHIAKEGGLQSFLQKIDAFYDPLSLDIMMDPVIINGEGTSYDSSTLRMWVESCRKQGNEVTSPLTRMPFEYPDDVSPNISLKSAIDEVTAQLKSSFFSKSSTVSKSENICLRTILDRSGMEGSVSGISSNIFSELDALRDMDLMRNLKLKTPQIIVFGDEKDGKSTLLERVVGFPIFPSRKELSTLCIIRVFLRRKETEMSTVLVKDIPTGEITAQHTCPLQSMSAILQKLMDDMVEKSVPSDINMPNRKRIIRDKEIIVKINVPYCPNLDVVDLPGLVNNPKDVREATKALADAVIKEEADRSIFLMVVKSSSNASQSLAPCLVTDHDLFDKTLGILTHLDRFETNDDDLSTEEALQLVMSPDDQNFFALQRPWLGCASKMPPKGKEMAPMTRLLQIERTEREILERKFPSFLAEEKPRLGLPAIRSQLTADFEQFICANWADDMINFLKKYFLELSDRNSRIGLPMPVLEEYDIPLQKLREIVPQIFDDYDVLTMFKLSEAQEYKSIVANRSKFVCRNGEWLRMHTWSLWLYKAQLEGMVLPSRNIDFDQSFAEVERIETEIIGYLQHIVASLVIQGRVVGKLFVEAALKFKEDTTTKYALSKSLPKNNSPLFQEMKIFVFSAFKPELQPAVFRAERFSGLLENFCSYMNRRVQEINCGYGIQANKKIDEVKGKLVSRKYIRTSNERFDEYYKVQVTLEWNMNVERFADSLISMWLDQLMGSIPTFATEWDIPGECLREIVSEERKKILVEMVDVVHAVRALKTLQRKYYDNL